VVVDADALNALADAGDFAPAPSEAAGVRILTPHPGEAARLLGIGVPAVGDDRPASARRLAELSGAIVVLKGHRSVIATPGGRVSFNTSGNPGLATAGTGDVLTGVIAALLARGLPAWNAARAGTFVHGLAGDLAARDLGQDGMIASDVLDRLPRAFAAAFSRAARP
jgi:NAD(P)H-hydrate epimerase